MVLKVTLLPESKTITTTHVTIISFKISRAYTKALTLVNEYANPAFEESTKVIHNTTMEDSFLKF